jgi:hypothetical protein
MELPLFYEKGEASPNYKFHFFNLNEIGWKLEVGKTFGILVNGGGTDPGTLLHFQLITITHESSSYHAFHSFYKEIQSEFPFSVKVKNLFFSLAETIAQTLNVVSCYVCRGMNMGDHCLKS